jgi:hypothetical protein
VTTIRLDPHLHHVGEGVAVPLPIARAAAWWIAAELVRRHPGGLRVIETHPGGGLYDCISIYRTGSPDGEPLVAHLNLLGHITHGRWFHGDADDGTDRRFNWFEVIASNDRRGYVIEQLERVEGLSSPKATPRTTRRSIGPLLLAHAALTISAPHSRWNIRNAYCDTSGYDSGLYEWARAFPDLDLTPRPGDLFGEPGYRYWGVLDDEGRARCAIDTSRGLAWRADEPGRSIDLIGEYEKRQRDLIRVAKLVIPELAPR